jgi:hypothetical protein
MMNCGAPYSDIIGGPTDMSAIMFIARCLRSKCVSEDVSKV